MSFLKSIPHSHHCVHRDLKKITKVMVVINSPLSFIKREEILDASHLAVACGILTGGSVLFCPQKLSHKPPRDKTCPRFPSFLSDELARDN